MKKDIYDLLNETKTNFEEYEVCEMTQDEKNKIKANDVLKYKLFKEKEKMKNEKNYSRKRAYAMVAGLAIVLTASFGSVSAFATTNPIAHSIADMFGLNSNLSAYATVLNQNETKDGITVNLSEVVYDRENNKVIVATSITNENATIEDDTIWSPHLRLYIDGEHINAAQQASQNNVDENTIEFVNVFMLKEKFEGDMDMNITVAGVKVNSEEIKERWKFEFTANGDALSADTYTYDIDMPVEIGNDESVVIETLNVNPISTSIFYSTEDLLLDTHIIIEGTDNLGQKVVFNPAPIVESGYGGELLIDNSEYTLTDDVDSFTLQVFKSVVLEDGTYTYVAIGDAFVAHVK